MIRLHVWKGFASQIGDILVGAKFMQLEDMIPALEQRFPSTKELPNNPFKLYIPGLYLRFTKSLGFVPRNLPL